MRRKRGQRGTVRVESGSWYGYYNTYAWDETQDPPVRLRRQRAVKLGPAEGIGKLSKWDAYAELAKEIAKITEGKPGAPRPDGTVTLENFTKDRWLPLKEAGWRESTKASAMHVLDTIFKRFGNVPLERLDKIELQTWLNKLATTSSKSVVLHCRFYLKSILEEAVDQDYLIKNPAKKLETPRTKKVDKSTLTAEQFRLVLAELKEPYNLLVRVAVACALRPSELLALRWQNFNPRAGTFSIEETIYRGKIRPYTKTTESDEEDQSLLTVTIPSALVQELVTLRGPVSNGVGKRKHSADNDFIFANEETGNFIFKDNLLNRVLYPVRDKLHLPVLNFQVLRRTMATLSQGSGSVKDVQSHLRHKTPNVTASEYMQAVPESARKMVESVYENLMTEKKA